MTSVPVSTGPTYGELPTSTAGGGGIPNPKADWDDGDWRLQARCRHTQPELFFPLGRTGPALEQIEAAKAVCRSCAVRLPCLRFALESSQDCGVWGGMSEDERRRLRRAERARRRLS